MSRWTEFFDAAERRLRSPATRLGLSFLIVLSVLPPRALGLLPPGVAARLDLVFLLIFGPEFFLRVSTFLRQWRAGRRNPWEVVLLGADFVALLSFLPVHWAFPNTSYFRLFRLTRLVLLLGYWGEMASDLARILLGRERRYQVVAVALFGLVLSFAGAVILAEFAPDYDYDDDGALGFFLPTTRYIAVYRALQKQGRTVEEAGRLIYRMGTEEALAIPPLGRRIMEILWFSRWFRKLAKKWAIKSQRRIYPRGFVETYVEGDGREFDYGIDYIECANCKFLQAENAFEIAPYVCATDKPTSELMGWGLTRPKTIAEGFPTCSFRFKKGGATNVPIPKSLQALLKSEPS